MRPTTARVWPASRSASVSPMHTIAHRPARQRGGGLRRDQRVAFGVIGPAFGVADDHRGGTCVAQHLSGDVAGVGAGCGRVAILAADRNAAPREPRHQRRGRADQHVATGRGVFGGELVDHTARCGEAVHLPVPGDEFAQHHPTLSCSGPLLAEVPGSGRRCWRLSCVAASGPPESEELAHDQKVRCRDRHRIGTGGGEREGDRREHQRKRRETARQHDQPERWRPRCKPPSATLRNHRTGGPAARSAGGPAARARMTRILRHHDP